MPDSCSQVWKLRRVRSSKALKMSSSWTVCWTRAGDSEAAVGKVGRVAVARRDLHVGLPQQALLPEHHAGVALDRGEAAVDLDLGDGAPPAGRELLALDLADVHAGHPHVRLDHQQRRLGEGRLEAVALRRGGQRAAERDPEEGEQQHDREGEAHDRRQAAYGGRLLVHGTVGRSEKSQVPNCESSRFWTGLPGTMLPSVAPETCSSRLGFDSATAVASVKLSSGCELGELEAADRDPPPRALGVGGVEERHAVLRGPGEPVEEALLAGALLGRRSVPAEALRPAGVVGADVEEAVAAVERAPSGPEPPSRRPRSPPRRSAVHGRAARTNGRI